MKKIFILIMLLIIPLNVFAYSNYIIPSGKTIGIEVNNDGIIIVGFYKINNQLNKNKLKVGDAIVKVNSDEVLSIEEFIKTVESNVKDNKVTLTVKRGNKVYEVPFELVLADGVLKTGLYVKDKITGIGTLTYIDPETKIYGALGHEITESASGKLIEVKTGKIFRSSVTKIDRSTVGIAGTKNAKFYSQTILGDVIKNTNKGIYGIYSGDLTDMEVLEVGSPETLEKGNAKIYTVLNNEEIKAYDIFIDNINQKSDVKNIHFSIISEELIQKAGGIVQGMSGSPIIQNNKIYGAVTHVILDNPTTGYGIFITTMLEEGER